MDYITILLAVTLFFLLTLNAAALWWIARMLLPLVYRGGPYVPTRHEDVERMIQAARLTPADRIADLGSGDGRIVIAAAKTGVADALGIEINGILIRASRVSAERANLKNTRFEKESFWKTDVSDRSVIFLYQVPYAMRGLETKLYNELPIGARVVSNDFKFVHWKLGEEFDRIRVYTKTAPT